MGLVGGRHSDGLKGWLLADDLTDDASWESGLIHFGWMLRGRRKGIYQERLDGKGGLYVGKNSDVTMDQVRTKCMTMREASSSQMRCTGKPG